PALPLLAYPTFFRSAAVRRPAGGQARLGGPARGALPSRAWPGPPQAQLSNLDKVFWPEEGITKGDLLAYYRRVAPVLVSHLKDRPFTMKRYPDGIEGNHFFQKDAPSHMPRWIPTRAYRSTSRETREKRTIRYP